MATSFFRADKGHRAKGDRSRFLGDADDNATAVVTIVNPTVGHIIIDEVVAGYNGAVAGTVTITRNAVDLQVLTVASGALGVFNRGSLIFESAAYIDAGFDVTLTLSASGAGGTDGFIVVRYRYENRD